MRIEAVLRAKPARIITIGMGSTVLEAARLLRRENVGAVLVKDSCQTEGDVLLGMMSERDVVQALVDHGAAALAMPVSAFMTRAIISCEADDTVDQVGALMSEHHVRHMPVRHGEALVGVISIRDLLALATDAEKSAGAPFAHAPPGGAPRPHHLN